MDVLKNGWFSEINDELWPGQCMSLKVAKVLHQEKSQYQDILVVQTANHGRALMLDNIIQCTEFDEFAYQEMIAFLPLCAHPNPSRVLIVGGGDGGVAREVVKHPFVTRITQVEIDGSVIEASKRHLPSMSKAFSHCKLELIVGDGFAYMQHQRDTFDVIITDSSDPIGPAEALFTESYFQLLAGALKEDGIICSQGGSIWNGLEHVKQTLQQCRKHFVNVRYAVASVPTYPSGQIGFTIACKDESVKLDKPRLIFTDRQCEPYVNLRYYDDEIHKAAFVLPKFARETLF